VPVVSIVRVTDNKSVIPAPVLVTFRRPLISRDSTTGLHQTVFRKSGYSVCECNYGKRTPNHCTSEIEDAGISNYPTCSFFSYPTLSTH